MMKYRIGIQDRANTTQKVTVERKRKGRWWLPTWEAYLGLGSWSNLAPGTDFKSVQAAKEFIDADIAIRRAKEQRRLVGKVRYQEYP